MSAPSGILALGTRCVLRRKRLEDAPRDYEWRRDPEIARLDGRDVYGASYDDFLAAQQVELEFPPAGTLSFAIESAGEHVGNLVVYNIDWVAGSCEFGVVIGRADLRGGGLGSDVVVTFLRYIWQQQQLSMVYLHTFEWNEAARRCFERCGFRAVARVQRPNGVFLRYEARREWWLMEDDREPYPRFERAPGEGD